MPNDSSEAIEKQRKHSPKNLYDSTLNNVDDKIEIDKSRKPFKFENNSNDISILNNKDNKKKKI